MAGFPARENLCVRVPRGAKSNSAELKIRDDALAVGVVDLRAPVSSYTIGRLCRESASAWPRPDAIHSPKRLLGHFRAFLACLRGNASG